MSDWVNPCDVFGKPQSKPYIRALSWLRVNANHTPKIDPANQCRKLYHQDDIDAYERNCLLRYTDIDWLETLKPYLNVPRSAGEVAYLLHSKKVGYYRARVVKKKLELLVKSGQVVRSGKGVRKAPYRYQLAEANHA